MKFTTGLIGYTGFVGSNLSQQTKFDKYYNSTNIKTIIGHEFGLIVCTGVNAVKWLANQQPEADAKNIEKLKICLAQTKINHLVLISTIDIYDLPIEVNEDSIPNLQQQDYYGKHRYQFEQWITKQTNIKQYTIIRLPSLFGNNLKKNLVFDIMNPLAQSVNQVLWQELKTNLSNTNLDLIAKYYIADKSGNLKQKSELTTEQKNQLIKAFASIGFSALNFTDSRSSFQFYNLANLWNDIKKFAITKQLKIINLSSEPIIATELIYYVTKEKFTNHTTKGPVYYAMYSKYALNNQYLYYKKDILKQINNLVMRNIE